MCDSIDRRFRRGAPVFIAYNTAHESIQELAKVRDYYSLSTPPAGWGKKCNYGYKVQFADEVVTSFWCKYVNLVPEQITL